MKPDRSRTLVLERLCRLLDDLYDNPSKRNVRPTFRVAEPLDLNTANDSTLILENVLRALDEGMIHTNNPRYFGFFNPAASFMSVAADAIVAAYNPQLGATNHSPAAVRVEKEVLRFFATQLGMRQDSSGIFSSGGAESNQTALLCALRRKWPSWRSHGISSMKTRLYASAQAHHSLVKAARIAGLGDAAFRSIPVDTNQRIRVDLLKQALEEDIQAHYEPFLIVSTYGTTNSGAIDDIKAVHELANSYGCWHHVDAAWGGAYAAFVPELRNRYPFKDVDSVSIDAHKALSVSMAAGMLFVRNANDLTQTFSLEAEYMPTGPEEPDYYLRSMQWSRRFIGLKVYMTLANWSADGYRGILTSQIRLTNKLRAALYRDSWRIMTESELPIVCFNSPELSDAQLRLIAKTVNSGGNSWLGMTSVDEVSVLRACVCNYRTSEQDIEELVRDLADARSSVIATAS